MIDIRTPGDSWYDFEHRYAVGLSEHVIPAPLPEDVYASVQDLAVRSGRLVRSTARTRTIA